MFKFNKSSGSPRSEAGQISRLLLVLAVVVLVAVVITFLVMKMAAKPAAPPVQSGTAPVLPIYEKQLGNIDFVFESAIDKGDTLSASSATNTQYSSYSLQDLTVSNPGAKFIEVVVGAQNKGALNTEANAWDIENIVDSQNREFIPMDGYTIDPWLPNPNLCGTLLKPAFDPTPCMKIYEVSKESTGLKIRVRTGQNNSADNLSSGKIDSALLDLIVK